MAVMRAGMGRAVFCTGLISVIVLDFMSSFEKRKCRPPHAASRQVQLACQFVSSPQHNVTPRTEVVPLHPTACLPSVIVSRAYAHPTLILTP